MPFRFQITPLIKQLLDPCETARIALVALEKYLEIILEMGQPTDEGSS